jgi:ketosteroid isomerase-like protein
MSIEILEKLFGAVDRKDMDAYLECFTEDAEYKAGSFPPVYGRQAIRDFGTSVIPNFTKVVHNIKESWQDGDTVICEMELVYHRTDGKVVTVPCLDILRLKNGKVKSLRAYLDASPAFV